MLVILQIYFLQAKGTLPTTNNVRPERDQKTDSLEIKQEEGDFKIEDGHEGWDYNNVMDYSDDDDYYYPPSKKSKSKKVRRKRAPSDEEDKNRQLSSAKGDPDAETQCYFCGIMTTNGEVFQHMRENHGRPSGRMHGPPRPYQCHNCKSTYETEETLGTHLCNNFHLGRPSEEDGLYHCPKCERTFTHKSGLKYHMSTFHQESRNFPCSMCEFKAKTAIVLSKHVKQVHTKEFKFFCPQCGKGFFDSCNMTLHMNTHVKGSSRGPRKVRRPKVEGGAAGPVKKEWKCHECDEVFPTSQGRSLHQSLNHIVEGSDVRVKCGICSKWTHTLWMPEHLRLDHPSEQDLQSVEAKCDKCDTLCRNAQELDEHYVNNHNKPSDHLLEYKCDEPDCKSTFHGKPSMLKHIADVHRRLIYACDHCIFLTRYRNILAYHETQFHTKVLDESQQFQCDLCGQMKRDLQGHMDRVHLREKVPCDRSGCDVLLEGTEDYHEHLMVDHGLRQDQVQKIPFPRKREEVLCPTCGKGFGNIQSLKAHISTIHEDTGKFMCDQCDFRTGHKQTLKRHQEAKHIKSNTYHCELCNYKAHVRDWVRTHVRLVHNKVKPFKCQQCDMAYGYSRDLQKHIEKVHS